MKLTTLLLTLPLTLSAADRGTLIFEDHFERSESQETKDEPGNGWTTSSDTRAGGNKQVDLKDGAMHITMHESADHSVSVRHDMGFQNGTVELRFMLVNPGDSLGLNFADMTLKTVHAGHLFNVIMSEKSLEIVDLKTGTMDRKIHDARKAGPLTAEQQKLLASKKKRLPLKLKLETWHALSVNITGDTISVTIDKKSAGSFSSEGFAHSDKGMLRLSVPKKATVDDVMIYSSPPAP